MSDKRQKNQLMSAFAEEWRGEARNGLSEGTESFTAKRGTESPAISEQLMEEVCERENCKQALARAKANKGSAGMDGMTVQQLPEHLKQHWPVIREQLLSGTYKPQPVKRVEIPKPDGGICKLGIPTALDRFIQQAVMQVLQRRWDRTFSEHSYGFRPLRSAHQAVEQAQKYIAEGYRWVVDLDLEKFFDRVNHDRLMAKIAERIGDKRMLKLIRAFLTAGVLEDGLVNPVDEGTPQGGPLSPLLSNIVLDEFDRELERRGLRFARYADDSNIYVRSKRAGERVMESITRFIATKLKLKVNQQKSTVGRPWARKFPGFSFTANRDPKRRLAPKAVDRFKELRFARDSEIDRALIAQLAEPPDADPHVRWCGRGEAVRLPPIPITVPLWHTGDFPCELSSPSALPEQVTAVVVTVVLLGLCAGAAAAPMDVPTRTSELDETPFTIPSDLDFPSPLIGQEVVFDPYSDLPDDSDALATLPLNTTLTVPEPPALLLFTLGLACLALYVAIRPLARLLRSLKKPRRTGRRKVRREFRMMA